MKFNTSAGHCPDGKGAFGAVGFLKESTEARKINESAMKYLKGAGHTVYDCTDNGNHTVRENLKAIVDKCDKHKVDYNVSVHLNAYKKVKADGKTKGVEVLVTGNYDSAEKLAKQICANIAALGFTNRGVKFRDDLYFLNQTTGASLLVETCFVDDEDDYKLYQKTGSDKLGKAIAYGLMGKTVPKETTKTETTKTETNDTDVMYGAVAGVFKNKSGCENRVNELKAKGFDAFVKQF